MGSIPGSRVSWDVLGTIGTFWRFFPHCHLSRERLGKTSTTTIAPPEPSSVVQWTTPEPTTTQASRESSPALKLELHQALMAIHAKDAIAAIGHAILANKTT
ncbi:Hypothetical predicted protein [Olea europaea subsp. europaea]|uniref:Uncharacterized protein n=1 Tax=Olea europaea subsp. europaea TaxID=158383 RepID=A0A8S0V541_OLEEU|nr:Hypothetical predicted protein [Olea europaea subsp. europaea]